MIWLRVLWHLLTRVAGLHALVYGKDGPHCVCGYGVVRYREVDPSQTRRWKSWDQP